MNILSLFDGISCGQLALKKSKLKYDRYYSSEIDEKSISVTQKNFPNTIQLGNVLNIYGKSFDTINLLIGGSPCQGFSTAGKTLNFNDPRSKLFFEYNRILKELKPDYFLLENVRMKREHKDIISEYLGVEPLEINSYHFSAQDRKRLYWTNIPGIDIRKINNKNIYLKNILEDNVDEKYYLRKEVSDRYYDNKNYEQVKDKSCVIGKLSEYQGDRIFDIQCKGSSLSASGGNNGGGSCNIIKDPHTNKLRRLTPIECERLQTIPDNYTNNLRDNERYKVLGDGWTVDVISYIFSHIKIINDNE